MLARPALQEAFGLAVGSTSGAALGAEYVGYLHTLDEFFARVWENMTRDVERVGCKRCILSYAAHILLLIFARSCPAAPLLAGAFTTNEKTTLGKHGHIFSFFGMA
jgi:hypothetical protein